MVQTIVRAAIYVRVSTEEQKVRGLSIDAQTTALESWAKQAGMIVVGYYNDAGITARKKYNKRPELLRLLEDVRAGKIDLIVFTKLDRWFRNIAEYYKVQEILETNNVNWKAIHEDYDTLTASGRLKINIMLSVAQDEADRDSERIKAVFASKRDNKEPVTGMVPTGYIVQGKKMVKDPKLEAAIAAYFTSYRLLRSITKAREEVQAQHGVAFSYQMADNMLRNPAYYGYFNGVEDMCPPYITKADFDLFAANRRKCERRTTQGRVYLFTGLVCCSECGRRLGARSHRYPRKGDEWGERTSYNCPGRYTHNDCLNGVNISERDIEAYLLEAADDALFELDAWAKSHVSAPVLNFGEEKAKLRRKLVKLKDLYINEVVDLKMYKVDYDTFTSRLDELTQMEAAAPAPRDTRRLSELFFPGWQEMYTQLAMTDKQSFWRMAIDKIEIHPDRAISFTLFV